MTSNQTTDWPRRFALVREKEASKGNTEVVSLWAASLEADWRAEYRRLHVEIARSRGWTAEHDVSDLDEASKEAFINVGDHDYCPRKAAEFDVKERAEDD